MAIAVKKTVTCSELVIDRRMVVLFRKDDQEVNLNCPYLSQLNNEAYTCKLDLDGCDLATCEDCRAFEARYGLKKY
ncbi:MAG: hypothetical protein ACFFD4_11450 [Candidatus Odinarchaeota archaeon]